MAHLFPIDIKLQFFNAPLDGDIVSSWHFLHKLPQHCDLKGEEYRQHIANICGWKQVTGKNFVIYRVVCLKKKSHRGMTAHLTMWGPCAVKTISLFSIFNINCTISSHFWQFHKQNSVLLCLSKTLIIKFISQCWWFLVSLLWGSKSSNPVS